jgi:hypothetical protein
MDEASFRSADASGKRDFYWSWFDLARETQYLLVLQAKNGARYLIPKRVFADSEGLAAARALLQNMVPDCQFQVAPTGFAVLPMPANPVDAPT